jgi:hypothetical protein
MLNYDSNITAFATKLVYIASIHIFVAIHTMMLQQTT